MPENQYIRSSRIDEDGQLVIIHRSTELASILEAMTERETFEGEDGEGVWTRITSEPGPGVSNLVSWKVEEKRNLPGTPMVRKTTAEDDMPVTTTRTLKLLSEIDEGSTVSGGVWTRIDAEPVSALVGLEVVTERPIPGNVVPYEQLDQDGVAVRIEKQLVTAASIAAIAAREYITEGPPRTWTKIRSEPVTSNVSTKVSETREV